MKKKLSTMLVIILAIASAFVLVACESNDNTDTALSKDQQIQIAKDTFSGIYNAGKKAAGSISKTNIAVYSAEETTLDEMADIKELFAGDKYEYTNAPVEIYPVIIYTVDEILTQTINQKNVDSINYIYKLDITNIGGENLHAMIFPSDTTMDFSGVSDNRKTYITIECGTGDSIRSKIIMNLCAYYNSESDYGYEICSNIYYDTDGHIYSRTFQKFDLAKSEYYMISYTDDSGSSASVIYNSNQIRKISNDGGSNISSNSAADLLMVKNLLQKKNADFSLKSTEIEQSNIESIPENTKPLSNEVLKITIDYTKL